MIRGDRFSGLFTGRRHTFQKEIMKHIGFTGTQVGMTEEQKKVMWRTLLSCIQAYGSEGIVFHLGDCIGADEEFYNQIKKFDRLYQVSHETVKEAFFLKEDIKIIGHIPNKDGKRAFCQYDEEREPKPYLDRNGDIVNESTELLAASKTMKEEQRSGTWSTIRKAWKKGINCRIILPDGSYYKK